jgi:hypothetical protein
MEKEIRQRIYEEIMALDLSEAKEISSDWYAGSMRTRMICAVIAKGGSNDLGEDR